MNSQNHCKKWIIEDAQVEYVLWTGRATSALYSLLKVLFSSTMKVVVPNNVCFSVIAAIRFAGMEPEILDIDPESQSISPALLNKLSAAVKRIVLYPHMYGIVHRNFLEVQKICTRRNWFLIEDRAQSMGASINGMVSGPANAILYSFGHGKIVDCGYGGALAVPNKELLAQSTTVYQHLTDVSLQNSNDEKIYGSLFKQIYAIWQGNGNKDFSGLFNGLISGFQGIFLHKRDDIPFSQIEASLNQLVDNVNRRAYAMQRLKAACEKEGFSFIEHPQESVYWRFNLLLPPNHRDSVMKKLHENHCHASSWFPSVDRFIAKRIDPNKYPISDEFEKRILNLWVSGVESGYIEKVIRLICRYMISVQEERKKKAN